MPTIEEAKQQPAVVVLTTEEKIEQHLRSIRKMMTFFTILVVLAIVMQGCSVLGLI
jgi:hypothetical protein